MTSNEYLERVRDFFGHDTFAMETTGIAIEDAAPGEATVTLDWSARHSNAKGGVMGGVLFTMADLAASIADWKEGEVNMTVDASMQYLHGAKDSHLRAVARAQRTGRTIGFYRVDITDGAGTLVAQGSFTYMHRPLA
ncbi:MAG: PaaI family thioesterase [Denitrobacterium sp.]|jgi:acyl-CoA thioesterase|nr:PaaI family thioesterase [Denitrobacterium sp.]